MPGKKDLQHGGYVSCPACSSYHLPTTRTLQDGVYSADCVNCGHFFKFKATTLSEAANSITFTVNGKRCTVSNEYAASTTLVHYLRETRLSMGTKAMCYEGGCGVCLVVIAFYHPQLKKRVEVPVNSCLLPLYSCDGYDVTTNDGLGNVRDGLHPIQQRLADKDGEQCGYCSSGQVINMFGLLKENPKPTMQQVEDAFDATICRCTGYRPILDAMKSFAVDAPKSLGGGMIDIEELDTKLCQKSGKPCTGHCSSQSSNGNSPCRSSAAGLPARPLHIVSAQAQWMKPTTLTDLAKLLKQYKTQSYRLVFGNTGSGVFKELSLDHYDVIIDTRAIDELYKIETSPNILLGANVSINNVMDVFDKNRTDTAYPWAGHVCDHWRYVAMNGIRNLGCWAGNIMMKHHHNEFPSDIFTTLEAVGVQLLIMDENGTRTTKGLMDFLKLDMKGKAILAMTAPAYTGSTMQFRSYRTSLRLQACHSYSVSAFKLDVDASQNYLVKSKPSILILGINPAFCHATLTENYLVNKKLGDPSVLKQAFKTLSSELKPTQNEGQSDGAFRKNLGLAMFYKCCLDICKNMADPRYLSGGPKLDRPLMLATQDYGTNTKEWPVTKPMAKTNGTYLTSGAPMYVDDKAPLQGQLHAAPVLSIYGNATVSSVDASVALAYPGVVRFIQAKDIPGVNDWRGSGLYKVKPGQELLSSGTILYAGQPIGLIVADRETTAREAAKLVKVTYTNIQPPLIDLKEAVAKKSFYPDPWKPTEVGNAEEAIRMAPYKVKGTMSSGDQYHFHMETQTSVCVPTDNGGMQVYTTTQWVDSIMNTVAQILGLKSTQVLVEMERMGGAFGGKISQNAFVAGLCSLAAYVTRSPVKIHLDIHENMHMLGKRHRFYTEYEAGADHSGKLLGIKMTMYEDLGSGEYESVAILVPNHIDGAYYCPNWLFTPIKVRTNKPPTTYCRAPNSPPGTLVMETIMEHLASVIKMDPMDLRKTNLYVTNQVTPTGDKLVYCNIRPMVAQLEVTTNVPARIREVEAFNKANRWRKRGLGLMPLKFPISWWPGNFNTMVTIFHDDGSVAISSGGTDQGQGINTKAIQVCAYELGIPMDLIRVQKASSLVNAGSLTTGGSVTSELVCYAIIQCCNTLKARMAPVKAKMDHPTWVELTNQCQAERIRLNASFMGGHENKQGEEQYNIYGCAVSEAEIDVLTGQFQIRQSDLLYDVGDSCNPRLDIGQAEGAFVFGLGLLFQESLHYSDKTGVLLNAGTWEYKPPFTKDLPLKFNLKFLKNNPNPKGVLGAKAIGEPPLNFAMSAFFAIKHAIQSARAEVGHTEYFELDTPCTVEKVQTLCMNNPDDFIFKPSSSSSSSSSSFSGFWRK